MLGSGKQQCQFNIERRSSYGSIHCKNIDLDL